MSTPIVGAAASSFRHASKNTSNAALVAQGKKFYRGKTITIIAPDNPGGGFDTYARIVGAAIGIYLHASVDITNIGAANTITGQDAFNSASPDGLTVGMINPGTDIQNELINKPGVNFNPLRVAFLGASGGGPVEFSCLSTSPYKTFAQVIKSANPVSEVIVTAGSQTVELKLINASFGFPTNVITGYSSTHFEVQGFERGDGQCSVLGIADIGSFVQAGKAAILFRTGPVTKGTAYANEQANAPLMSAIDKQFPAKTNREKLARAALLSLGDVGHQFNLQTKVAEDKVLAMRAAVQYAFTNASVKSKLLAAGQTIGFVNGAQAKLDYENEYKSLKHVSSLLTSAAA